jgi:SagB-type dehydrogenase family enzyme
LSRLFHLNSCLGRYTRRAFAQRIASFAEDEEAARREAKTVKTYPGRPTVVLPSAPRRGGRSLRRVLGSRRSRRVFAGRGLNAKELGALLGLSCGVTAEVTPRGMPDLRLELRSWPSGGALYPLEVYWLDLGRGADLAAGVFHYRPDIHGLERIGDLPRQTDLWDLIYADNIAADNAAGVLLVTALWARTQQKYGERGYRIVLLDAGHLGQNVLLVAEDLELNAVALGGFDDLALCELLEIERWDEEAPIHAVLLGRRPRRWTLRG